MFFGIFPFVLLLVFPSLYEVSFIDQKKKKAGTLISEYLDADKFSIKDRANLRKLNTIHGYQPHFFSSVLRGPLLTSWNT